MDGRRLLAVLASGLAIVGCRTEAPGRGGEEAVTVAPSPPSGDWVVVFAVGDPDSLEDESALIQQRAPGSIAVQPVSCWEGLGDQLDVAGDTYVAAVAGASEAEVERAAARVGLEVVFRGPAEQVCQD